MQKKWKQSPLNQSKSPDFQSKSPLNQSKSPDFQS